MTEPTNQLVAAHGLGQGLESILEQLKGIRIAEGSASRELGLAQQGLSACLYWLAQQIEMDRGTQSTLTV